MTTQDCIKLMDLFLDDELPLELTLEFKEAMFSDPELGSLVGEARRAREALTNAFAADAMTDEERQRVFARIAIESHFADTKYVSQLDLPFSGQLPLPIYK